jgi:peptidoglycan/xylan/chitin deacetylase (PgdA/CDA1 family)
MTITGALRRVARPLVASSAGWNATAGIRRHPCVVLAYHRISDSGGHFSHVPLRAFRDQMTWIRRHCTVLAPGNLRAAARSGADRPRVLITFDDGYRDYYDVAYPVLKALDIPAITFLSTRFIDDGRLFWWDVLTLAVHASRKTSVEIPWAPRRVYRLDAAGKPLVRTLYARRIAAAPDAQRETLLNEFGALVDVDLARIQAPRQVMTWDEVRASADLTTYGGHTHSHVRMSGVDEHTLEREIRTGRDRMQAEMGIAPTCFAYPFGDGTDVARRLLPRCGFDTAFNIIAGYVDEHSDWLDLHRFAAPATVGGVAWIAAGWGRQRPLVTSPAARASARA